jgi:hypothetical protein
MLDSRAQKETENIAQPASKLLGEEIPYCSDFFLTPKLYL